MTTRWETSDVLQSPMEICWQFAYEIDSDKLKALYTKAKQFQWDAEADLDWSLPVDPSRPIMEDDMISGVMRVPLIQGLSKSQRETLLAHLAAHRLSQFLHGEQGALMTAAALTHAVPDYQGKLYAATQTMDEARHVEVYARYIHKLAIVYPMTPVLKAIIDRTLMAQHWVKTAIGMNMIVEGLALASFHNMLRVTPCELLKRILRGVLRDESRHVAFGSLYVGDAVAAMHPDDREDVADFTFEIVRMMRQARQRGAAPDPGFLSVLDNSQIDRDDFMKSVATLLASGQRVEMPRDQIHPFKHLMMPALVRVGVITERARERYKAEGIPVWEDRGKLEQFEREEAFD
ncbi:MAG: ferritin-like domain-containing protein [Polyangiales bacterium]